MDAKSIIFSSVVKPVVSEDKNRLLALASLEELKNYIPKLDKRNIDLLPIATSTFVANHVNLNGAAVRTKEAVETAELFVLKQVNIGHNREKVCGVILNVAFSEFGTEKPLTKEEAAKLDSPFNVTIGGIIWKIVNEKLVDAIEESNDPTSEYFQKISASFEMSFDDYDIIILPKNSRYLSDGEIVSDIETKAELTPKLKTFGGDGKLDKDKNLAILIKGNVLPLGIGLTETPAAAVKGIATLLDDKEETEEEDEETEEEAVVAVTTENLTQSLENVGSISEKTTQTISQLENLVVKDNTELNLKNNSISNTMSKITSYKEITDEALLSKTITASTIVEFVDSELKAKTEAWAKEKEAKEKEVFDIKAKCDELAKQNADLAKNFETIKANFEKLEQEKAAKDAQDKFNARMTHFDEKFELTKEDRQVLAAQIKDLSDADFEKYDKNMDVLLKNKNKTVLAAAKTITTVASTTTTTTENTQTIVDEALKTATQTSATIPNTTTPAPKSLKDKMKSLAINDHVEVSF